VQISVPSEFFSAALRALRGKNLLSDVCFSNFTDTEDVKFGLATPLAAVT
jgi:hypothetical protein